MARYLIIPVIGAIRGTGAPRLVLSPFIRGDQKSKLFPQLVAAMIFLSIKPVDSNEDTEVMQEIYFCRYARVHICYNIMRLAACAMKYVQVRERYGAPILQLRFRDSSLAEALTESQKQKTDCELWGQNLSLYVQQDFQSPLDCTKKKFQQSLTLVAQYAEMRMHKRTTLVMKVDRLRGGVAWIIQQVSDINRTVIKGLPLRNPLQQFRSCVRDNPKVLAVHLAIETFEEAHHVTPLIEELRHFYMRQAVMPSEAATICSVRCSEPSTRTLCDFVDIFFDPNARNSKQFTLIPIVASSD